jgi:hypothetical protein
LAFDFRYFVYSTALLITLTVKTAFLNMALFGPDWHLGVIGMLAARIS